MAAALEAQLAVVGVAASTAEEASRKSKDSFLRLTAEYANYRARTDREKAETSDRVKGAVLEELIPLVDNFEAAKRFVTPDTDGERKIEAAYAGLYKQMVELFKKMARGTPQLPRSLRRAFFLNCVPLTLATSFAGHRGGAHRGKALRPGGARGHLAHAQLVGERGHGFDGIPQGLQNRGPPHPPSHGGGLRARRGAAAAGRGRGGVGAGRAGGGG